MSKEIKVAQSKDSTAFDKAFVKNDVRVAIEGAHNEIVLYTNDWATSYQVVLKGRKPSLVPIGRERAYR